MQEAFSSHPTPPPLRRTEQQHQQRLQYFSFGAASASLQLPVGDSYSIALMQNGQSLLLASPLQGLIEVSCTSARELSRWQPPSRGLEDFVLSVAALNDGRAAVGLFLANCISLLRRNETSGDSSSSSSTGGEAGAKAAGGNNAWVEEHRVNQLSSPAMRLSVHGDVLAASLWTKRVLLLHNLSSRPQRKAEFQSKYVIFSLAVATRVVVAGSRDKVALIGSSLSAYVLDAYSLDKRDERLWRYVLGSSAARGEEEEGEELWGICADSLGGCLYAAVCRSDNSSGRVFVLSLEDGRQLRRVALSFQPAAAAAPRRRLYCCFPCGGAADRAPLPLLPMVLSLCDDEATAAAEQNLNSDCSSTGGRLLLLAVLCRNPTTKEFNTLTLHRSTSALMR